MTSTSTTSINIAEILNYLPHRYPFLLVDRVTGLRKGESIEAYKNVSINEPFFQGHFPGHPIMPGVLILEAMAQVSGILAFVTRDILPQRDNYLLYFSGADRTRWKSPVEPGDKLDLKSEVIGQRNNTMKFSCSAYVGESLACTSQLLCTGRQL